MYENPSTTAQWLRCLMYVGIAAMVSSLLGVFLPGLVSTIIGYAINAATVYLFYRLIGSNERYKKAMIFSGIALVAGILGISVLSLAGSICALVGQYQEYYAHAELVAGQNPELAIKWSKLFWIQIAAALIGAIAISVVIAVVASAGEPDFVSLVAVATGVISLIFAVMKVLYLVYLNRTVKIVETEFVM